MKSNFIKSTVFGILSLHSLIASTTQAATITSDPEENIEDHSNALSTINAGRIIQKRLLGFDPKQAVETLTYLQNSGIEHFENDGSVFVSSPMVQNLMEAAAIDGIEVRILNFKNQIAKVKFAAYDINKFDRSRIAEAKKLAQSFDMKCDMDGKSL